MNCLNEMYVKSIDFCQLIMSQYRCQDLGNYRELTGQTKFQELTPSEIPNEDPQVATPLSKTPAPQPLPPHHPSPKQVHP